MDELQARWFYNGQEEEEPINNLWVTEWIKYVKSILSIGNTFQHYTKNEVFH